MVYIGPEIAGIDLNHVTDSYYEFLGSFFGRYVYRRMAGSLFIYLFFLVHDHFSFCSKEKSSYKRHINGFAALLNEDEVVQIASKNLMLTILLSIAHGVDAVVSVFLNKGTELYTTRS